MVNNTAKRLVLGPRNWTVVVNVTMYCSECIASNKSFPANPATFFFVWVIGQMKTIDNNHLICEVFLYNTECFQIEAEHIISTLGWQIVFNTD